VFNKIFTYSTAKGKYIGACYDVVAIYFFKKRKILKIFWKIL